MHWNPSFKLWFLWSHLELNIILFQHNQNENYLITIMNGNFLFSFSLNSFEVIFFFFLNGCLLPLPQRSPQMTSLEFWAKTREDQITRSCDSNAFLPAEKRNKCVRAVVLHQDAVTSGLWMQRQTLWVDYHIGGLNYYGLLLVAARNGLSAFTRSHSCFSNTKRKWNIWQQLNSWNLGTVWWRNEAPALLPARPVGLSVWLKHTDVSSWWMCLRAAE